MLGCEARDCVPDLLKSVRCLSGTRRMKSKLPSPDAPAKVRVFVPLTPKFICLTLTPKPMVFTGDTFGRCLDHEGGAFMTGIDALI